MSKHVEQYPSNILSLKNLYGLIEISQGKLRSDQPQTDLGMLLCLIGKLTFLTKTQFLHMHSTNGNAHSCLFE